MNLLKSGARIAACVALAWSAGAANADTYSFVLTGSYNASWLMDSSPTPDDFSVDHYFKINNVAGDFPGYGSGGVDLWVNSFPDYAGIGILPAGEYSGGFSMMGPVIFTGTEAQPTFTPGTYAFTRSPFDDGGTGTGSFTLTISAVPEPVSWVLMLGGLGLVGAAAVKRRRGAAA